ncbi:MAG: nucleotidyltransferase domain-containing protein [Candidatus Omnitrophota bacterium]
MRFDVSVAGMITSPVRMKVARFFLLNEALMSEREIASVLGISHMSVNRAVGELAAMNFIVCRTIGKAHVWTVSRKSYACRCFSAVIEAVNAQPTPLAVLKEWVSTCLPAAGVLKAVLFGSVAKGTAHADSDIDLFVVVGAEKMLMDADRLAEFVRKRISA